MSILKAAAGMAFGLVLILQGLVLLALVVLWLKTIQFLYEFLTGRWGWAIQLVAVGWLVLAARELYRTKRPE